MKSLLILALFCICQDSFVLAKKHRDATTATASAPSCDLIKSMKVAINHLFKRGPDGFIQLMSDSLRFAFHSCVGGCDGCINLKQGANAGLADIFNALEDKYAKLDLASQGVSRADFWAFAGMLAVEKGASLNTDVPMKKPSFTYQWGRKDCPTSPVTDNIYEFPSPTMTREQSFSFFRRRFGFNEQESAAILGAHNLGGASPENSGYNGHWKDLDRDIFNNGFFSEMLDPKVIWTNVDVSAGNPDVPPHWQWNGLDTETNETYMMFNTDFAIFFELDLDANSKATCKLDTQCVSRGTCGKHNVCPLAATYDLGSTYISKPDSFSIDFSQAMTKMLQNQVTVELQNKAGTFHPCSDPVNPPSCELIATMKAALLKLYGRKGSNEQTAALRFAFHTCVGGCHGCLNINQGDNAGLQSILQKLEDIYTHLNLGEAGVSRADFWALAGIVAVELGVTLHRGAPIHPPCFQYYWGRKDCPTAPITNSVFEFPAGWMTSQQMFSYFKRMFKFTVPETVAILGAHTLGMAEEDNSGFDGYWTPGQERVFNTTYYEAMIDPTLKWKNVNAGFRGGRQHWQWNAKEAGSGEVYFMLNTDFEIFFDLELDADGQAVCILDNTCVQKHTCGKNGICAQAATYEQGEAYALNNDVFFNDFKPTYTKMTFNGNQDLTSSGGTCESC